MVKNKNKHICVIVSCLLAVMVAFMPLFTLCNNKQTAKADSVTGWEPIVMIPSFSLTLANLDEQPLYTYTIPSLFISRIEGKEYRFYYPSSSLGTDGHYSSVTIVRNGDPVKFPFHGQRFVDSSHSYIYDELFYKQSDGTPNTYVDFNLPLGVNIWTDIYSYSVSVATSEANYGSFVQIDFLDINGNKLGDLFIAYCKYLEPVNNPKYFNFTTISNNISETELNKYLYQSGFQDGYNRGYNNGVNEKFSDITPWQYIVSGVNDFLSIKLFGDVSLSVLLSVAFGCILLGFAIKIFLGG